MFKHINNSIQRLSHLSPMKKREKRTNNCRRHTKGHKRNAHPGVGICCDNGVSQVWSTACLLASSYKHRGLELPSGDNHLRLLSQQSVNDSKKGVMGDLFQEFQIKPNRRQIPPSDRSR